MFLELDGKQQAFFEASEIREADGTIPYAVGEKVSANVVDQNDGLYRLGRSLGKPGSIAALEQSKNSGMAVDGKVIALNKGGLEVELGAARAFCPMSQIDTRRIEVDEAKAMIGQSFQFVVTDIKDGGKNVVVSRRAALSRAQSEVAKSWRAMSPVLAWLETHVGRG